MRKLTAVCLSCLLGTNLATAQFLQVKGSVPLSPREDVAVSGSLAYTVGSNSFSVVSFANPNSPAVIGQLAPGVGTLTGVAFRGDHVYCAGQGSGVVVIDADTPSSPSWVRNVLAAAPVKDVSVGDTFLVAATSLNVTLFGLHDPAQPRLLTAYGRPANRVAIDAASRKIHCAGSDGAFLLSWQVNQGVVTLSESDEFGSSEYSNVALGGSYVNFAQGLQFSALHPNTYTLAGQYGAAGQIRGLASGSNYSVIGLSTGGIEYLRQTGNTPQFSSSVQVTGGINSLAISGNDQYVLAATTAGLTVVENSALTADESPLIPHDFALSAFPNPFNSTTTISWMGVVRANASLTIFDVNGREVLFRSVNPSENSLKLDFAGFGAGSYFVQLAGNGIDSSPMRIVYLP